MKKVSRVLSMVLTVAMMALLSVSAFAADEKVVVDVDGNGIVNYDDVLIGIYGEDFLCREEDAIEDDSPSVFPEGIQPFAVTQLFSMRATEVEDFVRTSSDKEFSRADLTRGYLRITGDIMNSYSKNATVRIGGCWYNSITGVWEKDGYREVAANGNIRVSIPKSEFVPDMMLRGFIKNISGVGTVSGNLYFYNSDN